MNYTRVIPFCQLRQDGLRVEISPLSPFLSVKWLKNRQIPLLKKLNKGDGKVLFTRYVAVCIDGIGFNDRALS